MTPHPIDTEEARFGAEAHLRYGGGGDDLAENVLALIDALSAAEYRATRAEAQSAVRGRAVAIYQARAREAEAERDWNIRSSRNAKRGRIQANARADQAEARINAAQTILDEDTRWQNEEHLLARVRAALTT